MQSFGLFYIIAACLGGALGIDWFQVQLQPDLSPFIQAGQGYYLILKVKVNWFEALHLCQALDSNLLSVDTAEELKSIETFVTSNGYNTRTSFFWTAGNDLGNNREFQSVATGQRLPFYRWTRGEPSNSGGSEHCVNLWTTDVFGMSDLPCETKLYAICEKPSPVTFRVPITRA